jgi:glycosyltransferase involved in cell wall biosynthesis
MLRGDGMIGRLLTKLNAFGYRQADLVIDLGRYMKERIVAMGVRPERCHTVHVWSDAREIVATPREENPLLDQLGLRDKFVVMYSGNAGVVHDFRDILDAMHELRDDPRIHFLFVGAGPRRAEIETFVRQHDIRNFEYRGYFSRDELRYSLSVADAHLVSLREPFVGISVPGKLYGIMASGRPAVFVGPSRCESAEAIVAGECGVVIDPAVGEGATRLVETLRAWCADGSAARAMGARGRAAFETHYEREHNCLAFAEALARTWAPEPRTAAELVPEMAS